MDTENQNKQNTEENIKQSNETNEQNDTLTPSKTNYGIIKISEHVITEIARRTSLSVNGVVGLIDNKTVLDTIKEIVSNQKKLNDISIIKITEDTIELNIRVIIKYGSNLQDIAEEVQQKVAENIKKITDMKAKVHVTISDIEKTKTKK